MQNRQPKGTETGGQFAPSSNPESTVDLDDHGVATRDSWSVREMTIDSHAYRVQRDDRGNGVVEYMLNNSQDDGGWRIEYDTTTRRAKVRGIKPLHPTPLWRDRGEADIRAVMKEIEPDSTLIDLNGKTYLVDGSSWPLSDSHLSGLRTGEMILTGGKSEDELRDYVEKQRRGFDMSAAERPHLAPAIEQNRLYVDGIELAAKFGAAAAAANTVGAMKERGL